MDKSKLALMRVFEGVVVVRNEKKKLRQVEISTFKTKGGIEFQSYSSLKTLRYSLSSV